MKRFERQHEEAISPEAFTFILLKIAHVIAQHAIEDVVRGSPQHLDVHNRALLAKLEEELTFFVVFAFDYYWTTLPGRTEGERGIFRRAFFVQLRNVFTGNKGEERLATYGEIAVRQKNVNDLLWHLSLNLTRFCDMPPDSPLLFMVPHLWGQAMDYMLALKDVKLKLT